MQEKTKNIRRWLARCQQLQAGCISKPGLHFAITTYGWGTFEVCARRGKRGAFTWYHFGFATDNHEENYQRLMDYLQLNNQPDDNDNDNDND